MKLKHDSPEYRVMRNLGLVAPTWEERIYVPLIVVGLILDIVAAACGATYLVRRWEIGFPFVAVTWLALFACGAIVLWIMWSVGVRVLVDFLDR